MALAMPLALSACSDGTIADVDAGMPSLQSTASNVECIGALPAGTYDNVIVPPGAGCTLENSTVLGNVKALEGSQLMMADDEVRGNVEGDKAARVWVRRSVVGGNIKVTEGGGSFSISICCENVVETGNIQVEKVTTDVIFIVGNVVRQGNVQVTENVARDHFQVAENGVEQNLQVFKNTGGGTMVVDGNIVGDQVQCFENVGAFVGGPNAAPKKQGQCF